MGVSRAEATEAPSAPTPRSAKLGRGHTATQSAAFQRVANGKFQKKMQQSTEESCLEKFMQKKKQPWFFNLTLHSLAPQNKYLNCKIQCYKKVHDHLSTIAMCGDMRWWAALLLRTTFPENIWKAAAVFQGLTINSLICTGCCHSAPLPSSARHLGHTGSLLNITVWLCVIELPLRTWPVRIKACTLSKDKTHFCLSNITVKLRISQQTSLLRQAKLL